MQNPLITRWELTPEKKFKSFMQDLVDYLKCTLIPFEAPDGTISYGCTKYAYDDSYMEPFERVANFCIERNFNPHEVIDMIDEFTGNKYSCECGWLEDEKIANLIEDE